jgi:hypothetical protein
MKVAQRASCAFPNEKLQATQTVLSAEKFYDYADEHFAWAETARTERERAILLQMAAAWLEVAQKWEGSAKNADAKRYNGARFSSSTHTVESLSAPTSNPCQHVPRG